MPSTAASASLLAFALAMGLATAPAHAESFATSASSAGSSASSAGSASIKGSSNAISGSSDSATGEADVAAGEYRLAAIDTMRGEDGWTQLTLEPVAAPAGAVDFRLKLPAATVSAQALAAGDTIRVQRRPYGLEFTQGKTATPFYLVLTEAWERDLQSRVVASEG